MTEIALRDIIEALLMSAHRPLTLELLQAAFEAWERPEKEDIKQALADLAKRYQDSAIELKLLASGYCLQTKNQYSPWITRLQSEKPVKYSRALLETLAIIAYKQPVTRADIEEIRGVAVNSAILKTLSERDWIRIAGYKDVPGKPAVYVTTRVFLDYFNMASLSELPPLEPE